MHSNLRTFVALCVGFVMVGTFTLVPVQAVADEIAPRLNWRHLADIVIEDDDEIADVHPVTVWAGGRPR